MTAGVLIDTNVLVYAHDRGEPLKQQIAIETLSTLQASQRGRLSVQSLVEFFSLTTRGARPKLTVAEADRQLAVFTRMWPVFDLTALVIAEAARGVREHRLAYYDAQLWATAKLNQAPVIFSEDFAAGRVLEGVRFINPFANDFVLANWV